MTLLSLRELHQEMGGKLGESAGMEIVLHYGSPSAEYAALKQSVAALDLSPRTRLCLVGGERISYLNGQVTNDLKPLKTWEGCQAAILTHKGKMVGHLNLSLLENEILIDSEPGQAAALTARMDKTIVAEDAQVVDASPHYGLWSIQGPRSAEVLASMQLPKPEKAQSAAAFNSPVLGELYVVNRPRLGGAGFDLFVPVDSMAAFGDRLITAVKSLGGCLAGMEAFEIARIEAAIPRFGADMNENTLPPEAGLEAQAVSYSKGCYAGQEVIARIRTYGQVAKALRFLVATGSEALPTGAKLFKDGKEVGVVTSSCVVPATGRSVALGYVRRECNATGTILSAQWPGRSGIDVEIKDRPAPPAPTS